MPLTKLPKDYQQFLEKLKQKISSSKINAVRAVNKEMILMYHYIGSEIIIRQNKNGWGAKIIEQLSRDMSEAFPNTKGFSHTNLKYMKTFAQNYSKSEISQQAADQLPWFHLVTIITKIKNQEERSFYIKKSVENNWSRNILLMQIETSLYSRKGKSVNNFKQKLSIEQSNLAIQSLKDPYIFDFIELSENILEKEIEKSLIKHIEKFLLELGEGFAFVGRQHHLKIAKQDFYLDLLFYHIKLKCYVVVELKSGEFKAEHVGKMNFYLSAVDSLLKSSADNPSIGLILCHSKDKVIAEYALRDVTKPIGLSEYRLTKSLPKNIKTFLPTIKELENELKDAKN